MMLGVIFAEHLVKVQRTDFKQKVAFEDPTRGGRFKRSPIFADCQSCYELFESLIPGIWFIFVDFSKSKQNLALLFYRDVFLRSLHKGLIDDLDCLIVPVVAAL